MWLVRPLLVDSLFQDYCLPLKKVFGNKEKKIEVDGRKIKLITRNLNQRKVNMSYKLWNQIIRIRLNLLNLEMYI